MLSHQVKKMSEQPEFKWGEEVEFYMEDKWNFNGGFTYGCKTPDNQHIVFDYKVEARKFKQIRRREKITLTLSQIAEKFNYKPEQIKIV